MEERVQVFQIGMMATMPLFGRIPMQINSILGMLSAMSTQHSLA